MIGNPIGYPIGGVINYGGALYTQTITTSSTGFVSLLLQRGRGVMISITAAGSISIGRAISAARSIVVSSVVTISKTVSKTISASLTGALSFALASLRFITRPNTLGKIITTKRTDATDVTSSRSLPRDITS